MFGGWTNRSSKKESHIINQENTEYFMIWSTENMSWSRGHYVGNPPSARYGHTATAIGPHLLVFGGWELSKAVNDIVVLREFKNQEPKQIERNKSSRQNEETIYTNNNEN